MNSIHTPLPFISTINHEVDLLNPDPDTLDTEEMVGSLSRKGRYTDLSDAPWTVLKHSVLCGALASHPSEGVQKPEFVSALLLHDAHEAWMGDIARPLKKLLDVDGQITKIEEAFDRAIFPKYGVPVEWAKHDHPIRERIKHYDNIALSLEVRNIFPNVVKRWAFLPPVTDLQQEIFDEVRSQTTDTLRLHVAAILSVREDYYKEKEDA